MFSYSILSSQPHLFFLCKARQNVSVFRCWYRGAQKGRKCSSRNMAYRHQWGWVHTQHLAGLGFFLDAVLQCIWAIILLKQRDTELSGFAHPVISRKGIERSSAWRCHPARGCCRKICCCCRPAAAVLWWPCLGSAQCWQAVLRQDSSSCRVSGWGSNGHFCRRIYCPAPAWLCCPLCMSWGKEKHWQAGQWKVATSSSVLARMLKQVQAWSCAFPSAIVLSVHPLASHSPGTPLFSLF